MAYDNTITIIGNLTRDPELKEFPSGSKVCNFSIAWNKRTSNKETGDTREEAHFHDCVAWGDLGEHIANSCSKGTHMIIYGALMTRSWETDDGATRTKTEVQVEHAGPSLRFQECSIQRTGQGSPNAKSASQAHNERPF